MASEKLSYSGLSDVGSWQEERCLAIADAIQACRDPNSSVSFDYRSVEGTEHPRDVMARELLADQLGEFGAWGACYERLRGRAPGLPERDNAPEMFRAMRGRFANESDPNRHDDFFPLCGMYESHLRGCEGVLSRALGDGDSVAALAATQGAEHVVDSLRGYFMPDGGRGEAASLLYSAEGALHFLSDGPEGRADAFLTYVDSATTAVGLDDSPYRDDYRASLSGYLVAVYEEECLLNVAHSVPIGWESGPLNDLGQAWLNDRDDPMGLDCAAFSAFSVDFHRAIVEGDRDGIASALFSLDELRSVSDALTFRSLEVPDLLAHSVGLASDSLAAGDVSGFRDMVAGVSPGGSSAYPAEGSVLAVYARHLGLQAASAADEYGSLQDVPQTAFSVAAADRTRERALARFAAVATLHEGAVIASSGRA